MRKKEDWENIISRGAIFTPGFYSSNPTPGIALPTPSMGSCKTGIIPRDGVYPGPRGERGWGPYILYITGILLIGIISLRVHADEVLPVTVATIEDLTEFPENHAPATVVSINHSRIAAEISGRLEELPVKVGDLVEKESLLARLDCQDHLLEKQAQSARLQALNAQHDLARFQLKRAESLAKNRNVSEELLNQRQSEMRVVEAQRREQQIGIALVERRISKCSLQAPFAALITDRLANVGEWLNPGHAVVKLLDLDDIEVSAQVPTTAIEGLREARNIRFINSSQPYTLQLKVILPAIDTRSRSSEVRLTFIREQDLPGTAGRVVWQDRSPHLPAALVVKRNGQRGIFILEEDKASFHPLPQALAGRPTRVSLPPATLVILEGRFSASDGQQVRVQE